MTLGQRLLKYRKDKNLSQEEVAEKLDVSRQTISKWETDQSVPDFDKIVPICKLYGISSEELLSGEKTKKEMQEVNNSIDKKKKRTSGLVISIFLYFVAVAFIMTSIPTFKMNPVLAASIFLIIIGLATCIIIYTHIMYKDETKKEEKIDNKLYKAIDDVAGLIALISYLLLSFLTGAWHITWIIWIIYPLVMEIIKLVFTIVGDKDEK